MSSTSMIVVFEASALRCSMIRYLCRAVTWRWIFDMEGVDMGLPLRVKPKSSGVLMRTSSILAAISSSILFKQKLRCLNWGHLSKNQLVTSLPSASLDCSLSSESRMGTGSSGFFCCLSFLFFSIITSRFFSSAWYGSTWSAGSGTLPKESSIGRISSVVSLFLARPRNSSERFCSKTL